MVAAYDNHIILCRLGRLGYSILLELVKMGKEVAVVELRETAHGISEARRMNIPVIIEDARNEAVQAKTFIIGRLQELNRSPKTAL